MGVGSQNSEVVKELLQQEMQKKRHVMMNVSPNCKGAFPERMGIRAKFSQMTQQH